MRCPIKDDVHALLDKMLAADGIILATPNYINQVTAALKAVLDRSSHFIHCKRLLGKYLCGVVTSGSGAQFSGGVSACAYAIEAKKAAARKVGKSFARDMEKHKQYPSQTRAIKQGIAQFGRIMNMRKEHWRGEYAYWKEKGWLRRRA